MINSVTLYDFLCALSLYCYLHCSVEPVNLFSLIFQIRGLGTSSSPFSLMYKNSAFALDRQLTEAGAHVVMAVRSTNRAQELIWKWQEEWSGKGLPLNIEVMELDLLSLDSVTRFAEAWNARMEMAGRMVWQGPST